MMRRWLPIRIHYYPNAGYGWKRLSYLYYRYDEDAEQEHELWLGKFCISFG